MSERVIKQDNHLKNILIGAAALATLYAAFQFFSNNSASASKTSSLQLTQKVLKEIKYQMCANCISFAEGVNIKLKAKYPEKELELYLRTEIAKLYDQKEELILTKYQLPKQQYGAGLRKYSKNNDIHVGQKQIFDMLERAVKGQFPDLTVKDQARNLYNNKQVLRVYYEMCEQIATRVWLQFQENRKKNPNFNSKDDAHFKKAIRNLSIYEFKVQYLEKKGYKKQWGCPNMTFFKIIESIKINSPEIKKQASFIEKSYEILIAKISADPHQYDRRRINHQMQENFQKLKNPIQSTKPMLELMKKPSVTVPVEARKSQVFSSVNKSNVQQNKKVQIIQQDQFDLQKMMMNQLLSRSQEEPVEQKLVQKPSPAIQINLQKQPLVQQVIQRKEDIVSQEAIAVKKVDDQQPQLSQGFCIQMPPIEKREIHEEQSLLISKEPEQLLQQNIQPPINIDTDISVSVDQVDKKPLSIQKDSGVLTGQEIRELNEQKSLLNSKEPEPLQQHVQQIKNVEQIKNEIPQIPQVSQNLPQSKEGNAEEKVQQNLAIEKREEAQQGNYQALEQPKHEQ